MKQPRWMPASASRSLCAGRRLTPASKLWCIVRTQVHQATHVFPVGSEVESLGQHVSHIVCCRNLDHLEQSLIRQLAHFEETSARAAPSSGAHPETPESRPPPKTITCPPILRPKRKSTSRFLPLDDRGFTKSPSVARECDPHRYQM